MNNKSKFSRILSFQIFILLFLILLTIACGGGSGSVATSSDEAAKEISLNEQVAVSGTVSFPGSLSKAKLKPEPGQISFKNISSGDETLVPLASDGSYSANIIKGDYDITAVSSDGKVVKLIQPNIKENMNNVNPNLDSTALATFMLSSDNDLTQMTGDKIEESLLGAKNILNSADDTLTLDSMSKSKRSAALAILSIKKKIEMINLFGSANDLLDIESIKNKVTSQEVINEVKVEVVKSVIVRTNKTVRLPTNTDDLFLSTIDDVEENKDLILIQSVIVVQIIEAVRTEVNNVPLANAGKDITIKPEVKVYLNGSLSFDADGDVLTYQWGQVSGPTVVLSDLNAAQPNFVAPKDEAELVFRLIVNDGKVSSLPELVRVFVKSSASNTPPRIVMGPDQSIHPGHRVQLDASKSFDDDGNPLSFQWVQLHGEEIELRNGFTSKPFFNAPRIPATNVFQVLVSDGIVSKSKIVTIKVLTHAPIANAGDDVNVHPGDEVKLNGAYSSDRDGDSLSYLWSQQIGEKVTLSSNQLATPSFTVPLTDQAIEMDLVVNDGIVDSFPDRVRINVINRLPTVSAGDDMVVLKGQEVFHSAIAEDPDGFPVTISWSQTEGESVVLQSTEDGRMSFTAPNNSGRLLFQARANDGLSNSQVDGLSVLVNHTPIANAMEDIEFLAGTTVNLNGGSSYDEDSHRITYSWKQTNGSPVILSSTDASNPSLTLPEFIDELVFELVVHDGYESSS